MKVSHIFSSLGYKIVSSIKFADSTLGPTIFAEIGIALFSLAVGFYFVCTIYALFSPPFSWVVLVFIIFNSLGIIIATLRIAYLTFASEQINSACALAKEYLQIYQVPTYHVHREGHKEAFTPSSGKMLYFLSKSKLIFAQVTKKDQITHN
jgi:hypothetical protein